MDAAQTTLKKIALLLAFALLCLGPWSSSAYAQPTILTCGSINITNLSQFSCAVSSSTGVPIPYTVSSVVFNPADPRQGGWLGVTPQSGTISGTGANTVQSLTLQLTQTAGVATNSTATITLTPTAAAPAGSVAGTIIAVYAPSSSGGGGGNGLITANPTSLNFCNGCYSAQSVVLTTSSVSAVPFTINAPSWLTVQQSTSSVSSTASTTISVSVNNFSQASSATTVSIVYNGGPTNIAVTIGGSGSGVLSVSPSSISWSYNSTTGAFPSAQYVTITDNSGASAWNANIAVTSGDPLWLTFLNGNTGINGGFSANISTFYIQPTSNVASLSNGTHTATVTINDSNNNQTSLFVSIAINTGSGSNNGLTVSPSAVTLPNVVYGSTTSVSSSVYITSTTSGTASYNFSGSCFGISGSFYGNGSSTASIFAGSSAVQFVITGNPTGLSQTTYNNCSLNIYLINTSATVSVPITWVIGSGSGTGFGNPVLPTAMSFVYQIGASSNTLVPQAAIISPSGAWTSTTQYNSGSGWLTVPASGTGPGPAPISVSAANLSVGNYSATVTFTTAGGTQAVSVAFQVASSPVIYISAGGTGDISLQGNNGTIIGAETFQVLASDGSNIPYTASTSTPWLSLYTAANGTTPQNASFTVNLSNLANGVYYGSINISAPSAANGTVTVPIVLTVTGSSSTGGGNLNFSTSSLAFTAQVNGSLPASQNLTVTAPTGTTYTASASGTYNNTNWLSISPSGYVSNASQNISVSVNQGSLPAGNYNGSIIFYPSGGGSQSVTVSLSVTTTGTNTVITASPTSLNFSANQNGSAQTLTVSVTSQSGSSAVSFGLSTNVASGTGWLSATTAGYVTPATISVTVTPGTLTQGTYTGTVVISPTGGSAVTVPVTLAISGLPSVSASPTSLNLSYSVGGTVPTTTINVTGGSNLNYTTSVSSNCNCISVSPSSGNTTSNPTITVTLISPTTLTAGGYTGSITVSGTNGSTGNTTVTVNLTVAAPLPTVTALVNAASGASGPVSPGEIVSIFGTATNPIGPATPVALSGSDLVNGNVPTTGLAGATVTFNGRPAALTYVSSVQINAVVPYGVAGFNNFPVIVTYLGQNSNGFTVQTTTSVPGIFTQNGSGSGPADVLNSDGRTNGPNTPAAKGSTVSVYLTGEGATTPKGVDGQVTCSAGCSSISQIPVPLLPVAVLVDGQPATITFYGEAPLLVAGVLQVNFTIPTTVRSGPVPLVVSVGGNSSQQNVTVQVQ